MFVDQSLQVFSEQKEVRVLGDSFLDWKGVVLHSCVPHPFADIPPGFGPGGHSLIEIERRGARETACYLVE